MSEPVDDKGNFELGYWAAQEQYSLHDLLDFAAEAERVGFGTTMTSDHFHPWWHDGAHGNSTWIWIAAAAERTRRMRFVTGVTAPIFRYHPAIVAQTFASLDVLYPSRIALGLGTGEAMNEYPLGYDWPSARIRLERTEEALDIIKSLWGRGDLQDDEGKLQQKDDFVSYKGEHFTLRNARLYTPPRTTIPLYMASAATKSTKLAARKADGIITFLKPKDAKPILALFDRTAKANGRDPSSLKKIVEYKVSYSDDYEEALKSTEFWRATLIDNVFNSKISDPRKLENKAKKEVPFNTLKQSIHVTTSIEDCIKAIQEYSDVGFTGIQIHSTSPDERKFIEAFSQKVLPYFRNLPA